MKAWILMAVVACIAAALTATYVFAQQPPESAPPGAPPGPQAGPPQAPHDRPSAKALGKGLDGLMGDKELREMVETVMMAKLSTRLGLSDEQAFQLVRQRSKVRDETQMLAKERREKLKALEAAVKAEKPDDADVNAKLDELMGIDEKIASIRRRAFDEAGKNLTGVQRAKLYTFINEFENDMRQLVNRARERGLGQGPIPPSGPGARDGAQGPPGPRDGMPGLRGQFRENLRKNLREGELRPLPPGEDPARPNPPPPVAPPPPAK
ncbi:MAG: hypothetical protein HZB26_18310 [Candidatus Hydrogenedentes bacterium]|nr:hypothetical protein [Candidatus Hydrogenedentota bacterium]